MRRKDCEITEFDEMMHIHPEEKKYMSQCNSLLKKIGSYFTYNL